MEESILTSIKKLLGIEETCIDFDTDVKIAINSAFSALTQIGVGPSTGFAISDKFAIWNDFLLDNTLIENAKSYTYLKVKLLFDPPANSSLIEAYNQQIKEMECRIFMATDNKQSSEGEN